jgi:hypothetical protein
VADEPQVPAGRPCRHATPRPSISWCRPI